DLAGAEGSPLPLAWVVDRLHRMALRALRRGALVACQPHVHRAAGHIELDPLHSPRGLHSQNRRVQLMVPHRPHLLARRGRRDDTSGTLRRSRYPHETRKSPILYVLEGSVVMQVKGGKQVTLTPGQTFYEGPDDVHVVDRNASSTQPTKLLVFLIKDKGAPVLVPVE